MKILHTSDWHVGKTLARRSRLDECRQVLSEIVDIAQNEQVDAVLVCGDVFDHQSPSAEAEKIVYDSLLAFERGEIPVLLLPGNHDHARRWKALEPLLSRFVVRVVPEVRRPDKGGIVRIPAHDSSTELQVAVLPWVYEQRLFGARETMGLPSDPFQTYADEMAALIEALCEPLDPSACTVFAGHLFVSGSRPGEAQRGLTIGQLYAVSPKALPEVQYSALGHIHRPQQVTGTTGTAYYSGSPMQLDFGEIDQEKGVSIVELHPGEAPEVRSVRIRAGHRLRDVTGTLDELEAQKETYADAFLRVTLRCGGPLPGLGDEVRSLLPNAMQVRLDYPRSDKPAEARIRGLTPREQYGEYLRAKHEAEPNEDELDLFDRLLEEVAK